MVVKEIESFKRGRMVHLAEGGVPKVLVLGHVDPVLLLKVHDHDDPLWEKKEEVQEDEGAQ